MVKAVIYIKIVVIHFCIKQPSVVFLRSDQGFENLDIDKERPQLTMRMSKLALRSQFSKLFLFSFILCLLSTMSFNFSFFLIH